MENNWDPLDTELAAESLAATLKRQIKNILDSYTGWYDLFCELIQNALDAVDQMRRLSRSSDYKPSIYIMIDLKENLLCVTDNGIGFTEDQFKGFLAPNVSYKKGDNRGSKGVGATYIAYGFNYLQFGTKTSDFSFLGTLQSAREWVEDSSGTIIRPKVLKVNDSLHECFRDIDQGSTFV
ncbi:MAG: ATP-binding protein [Nitrospirae bacterium]|nr:ATP-binding protein [Nitrospirota bacterium]MBF0535910.1 ATP-binding protein [Nitrospirota bacterium]MBF0617758.1 ATP-binding protein [Nitrospirota bacterium]